MDKKYTPNTVLNFYDLVDNFTDCSLPNWKCDPNLWFTELDILYSRLNGMVHEVNDEKYAMHIIKNLPEKYDVI